MNLNKNYFEIHFFLILFLSQNFFLQSSSKKTTLHFNFILIAFPMKKFSKNWKKKCKKNKNFFIWKTYFLMPSDSLFTLKINLKILFSRVKINILVNDRLWNWKTVWKFWKNSHAIEFLSTTQLKKYKKKTLLAQYEVVKSATKKSVYIKYLLINLVKAPEVLIFC